MLALDNPVITGEPEIVGLVKVLLVKISVVSLSTTVPVALGKVIVRSAVGSTTVRVVSYASAVVPSNTMFATSIPPVEVRVGLLMIGEVKVLFVSS
jgi:hypothetical protein